MMLDSNDGEHGAAFNELRCCKHTLMLFSPNYHKRVSSRHMFIRFHCSFYNYCLLPVKQNKLCSSPTNNYSDCISDYSFE